MTSSWSQANSHDSFKMRHLKKNTVRIMPCLIYHTQYFWTWAAHENSWKEAVSAEADRLIRTPDGERLKYCRPRAQLVITYLELSFAYLCVRANVL